MDVQVRGQPGLHRGSSRTARASQKSPASEEKKKSVSKKNERKKKERKKRKSKGMKIHLRGVILTVFVNFFEVLFIWFRFWGELSNYFNCSQLT